MIVGTSATEWILIRLSIIIFRYTPALYAAFLLILYAQYGWETHSQLGAQITIVLLGAEALFYNLCYIPHLDRLKQDATHPAPLTPEERNALFEQCLGTVSSLEEYLCMWFLGAELEDIHRDNLKEWLLWAFFEQREDGAMNRNEPQLTEHEIRGYIARMEQRLGYKFKDGRGKAESLRLTFDPIETTYRSFLWYFVVFLIDQTTHMIMRWHGFDFYGRPQHDSMAATLPPRPQDFLAKRRSKAPNLSYWHRPHTSKTRRPVVFFHGIGVGLWPYTRFLAKITALKDGIQDDNIGVIAIEILPISSRLTSTPLSKTEFLHQMTRILDSHDWSTFAVASHSYGSVMISQMLRCTELQRRITSAILIDPVTIMLHLPSVAYNFTRRRPKKANEWQLWYYASTDLGVAHCLGRHFFWRENIIWKEELLPQRGNGSERAPRVAVCLAGKDLIIDAAAVEHYLVEQMVARPGEDGSDHTPNVEVVVFPRLDHAQALGSQKDRRRVVQLVGSYCRI